MRESDFQIYLYVGGNTIEVWVIPLLGPLACICTHKQQRPDHRTSEAHGTSGHINSIHDPGSRRGKAVIHRLQRNTRIRLRSTMTAIIHSRIRMYSAPLDGGVQIRVGQHVALLRMLGVMLEVDRIVGRQKTQLVPVEAVGCMERI